jgi:hypothetical protein
MNEIPEPDAFEKRVRFGCGFVFGLVAGCLAALKYAAGSGSFFWMIVAGVAILLGLIAVRYGDKFWASVADWLGWW